jgi:hypothetical protein
MRTGSHGDYSWMEWEPGYLRDLLWACPQIVRGRYLAVTSFDSGPRPLLDEERQAGWISDGGIAFSPPITDVGQLALGEYDEWYVFDEPVWFPPIEVFINYCGFSLRFPQDLDKELAAELRAMQDRFWSQLEGLRPESYLGEGDRLVFVTRSRDLAEAARGAFPA